jgi:hypothetical protein
LAWPASIKDARYDRERGATRECRAREGDRITAYWPKLRRDYHFLFRTGALRASSVREPVAIFRNRDLRISACIIAHAGSILS